jgi:hypothetical protein
MAFWTLTFIVVVGSILYSLWKGFQEQQQQQQQQLQQQQQQKQQQHDKTTEQLFSQRQWVTL